jgi:hypothetical protein
MAVGHNFSDGCTKMQLQQQQHNAGVTPAIMATVAAAVNGSDSRTTNPNDTCTAVFHII